MARERGRREERVTVEWRGCRRRRSGAEGGVRGGSDPRGRHGGAIMEEMVVGRGEAQKLAGGGVYAPGLG